MPEFYDLSDLQVALPSQTKSRRLCIYWSVNGPGGKTSGESDLGTAQVVGNSQVLDKSISRGPQGRNATGATARLIAHCTTVVSGAKLRAWICCSLPFPSSSCSDCTSRSCLHYMFETCMVAIDWHLPTIKIMGWSCNAESPRPFRSWKERLGMREHWSCTDGWIYLVIYISHWRMRV